jgi:hypothetical protein
MAAVVQWARAHGKHISIFAAKHGTESGRRLGVEELRDVLRYGDDSQLPTPGLFFYAQGRPVVVTRNQFVGLKVVNGAPFKAVDIFPDFAFGTIALASDVTLHLGPPVAVVLQSDDSAGLAIPGLPNSMILIKSKTVAIPNAMRGKEARSRGKPGFRWVTHRTGPPCTPAFAMTDQKSQGKQFSDVLVNLKGIHSSGTATRPSFMSLYVQLSRAESWDGLHLFRKPARGDFRPDGVSNRTTGTRSGFRNGNPCPNQPQLLKSLTKRTPGSGDILGFLSSHHTISLTEIALFLLSCSGGIYCLYKQVVPRMSFVLVVNLSRSVSRINTVPRRHLIGHERGGATPQQISANRERDTGSDRTSVHLHCQDNSETLIVGRKTAKVAAKNNSQVR